MADDDRNNLIIDENQHQVFRAKVRPRFDPVSILNPDSGQSREKRMRGQRIQIADPDPRWASWKADPDPVQLSDIKKKNIFIIASYS